MAVLRPLKRRDRELSGRSRRGDGRRQQPGGSVGRHAEGAVLARALHRAGRLPRGSAEEVLPPRAGPRGPAAQRVLHHVHGRREGRGGEIVELRCTYDPATRGGDAPDGRKVKATLHWVSAAHARPGGSPALRSAVQRGDARAPAIATTGWTSIRRRSRSCATRASSRAPRTRRRARAISSSASATSASTPTPAGQSRLQPHGHAQGQLGENPATRRGLMR